ncbi:MAG: LPS translocon maturation chaperone LptM [Hyphomicrobiales bacterium]
MKKFVLLVLLAATLAACGVRGDPEPPPQFHEAQ